MNTVEFDSAGDLLDFVQTMSEHLAELGFSPGVMLSAKMLRRYQMNVEYAGRLIFFLVLAASGSAAAEEKVSGPLALVSGPPEQCISLIRINRTSVIDDQNILFYMKGAKIYRNYLPHRCPGLGSHEAFMYRTSLNQLCHLDIITVLDSLGFGFTPGVSCGLGHFYPVTKEDAEVLEAQRFR